MNHHDPQLQRAEALLRSAGAGEAEPTDPAPPAADVGARAGLGRRWPGRSVRASVYLFDSHDAASAAAYDLAGRTAPERDERSTVNGPLLLWAGADPHDETDRSTLVQLVSAFAGREKDRE